MQSESFQNQLQQELNSFLDIQNTKYPSEDLLKIDLHCHDYNSKVPDEILGRILGVPETWLSSEVLLENLKKSGCDTFTITNHNNANSCWELKDQGVDILVGTEFSVKVPDFNIGIHVLAYGFTKEDENILNKLRYDVYEFLKYTHKNSIPTVWAHPLYHYAVDKQPSFDFFNKMSLIFERFEVLNGQRDTWQNILVKEWITQLTADKIDKYAKRFGLNLSFYTNDPYKKSLTGGSDDHMGIFAGHTGSYLYVPQLKERLKTSSRSELALEAIREHRIIPYGGHQDLEKLTVAFLDYVFQVAINFKKPDLIRMLLHKGNTQDKIIAIVVSNLFTELKHHNTTMLFIKLFHKVFMGKKPYKITKLIVKKAYKPIFDEALNIADSHQLEPDEMTRSFYNAINDINNKLNKVLFKRFQKKIDEMLSKASSEKLNIDKIIESFEISPNIRDYIESKGKNEKQQKKQVTDFLDGLSFPFFSSVLIFAANFTSAKVMYNSRNVLNEFSNQLGVFHHPKRMLWLTDTFDDKNGVSSVLQEIHKEIKRKNLPIDILVCSNTVQPDEHLIVMKPEAEIKLPFYHEQTIRIPNVNDIHRLFLANEYDRLMCSTEGVMGLISILLKKAYSVPAYFFMHTDWIMFARKKFDLDNHKVDKVRRVLRMFYGDFDKLFVLNNDHKKWLSSPEMDYEKNKICKTSHWVDEKFEPLNSNKKELFGIDDTQKVLLYAGRLSEEKGVMDVVTIYKQINKTLNNVKLVFAGVGPAEEILKKALPDALFLGWVKNNKLPEIYSSADLLLLPSIFDTFGLVVLEALSCGLPVAAYNAKGPKDIIEHKKSGFVAANATLLSKYIIDYFSETEKYTEMKQKAFERAKSYSKNKIIKQLLLDVELS
jgi:glycosyltransferase involved in cell wall biosynthesis/ribosome-associated translation inhibitor RaiA